MRTVQGRPSTVASLKDWPTVKETWVVRTLVDVLMDRLSPCWAISTAGLEAAATAIFLRNTFTPDRTDTRGITLEKCTSVDSTVYNGSCSKPAGQNTLQKKDKLKPQAALTCLHWLSSYYTPLTPLFSLKIIKKKNFFQNGSFLLGLSP